jgi:hypothetical protein
MGVIIISDDIPEVMDNCKPCAGDEKGQNVASMASMN